MATDQDKNIQNNANTIQNAAEVAEKTKNPYAMAAGKAVKIADKVTDGKSTEVISKGVTRGLQNIPGGRTIQNASNVMAESGMGDKIGASASLGDKDKLPEKEQLGSSDNGLQNSKSSEKFGFRSNSDDQTTTKKEGFFNKLSLGTKIKIMAIGVGAFAFLIFFLVLFSLFSGESGSIYSRATYNTFYQNLDSDDPEYKDYFVSEEETKDIRNGQKNFYNRIERIYNYYKNPLLHPGIGEYPYVVAEKAHPMKDYQPNYEAFEATRMHIISTIFVEYTPETFTENIDPDETNYNDKSAYVVCDGDDGCPGGISESKYQTANMVSDLTDGNFSSEFYRKETDEVRKLVRNTIIYRPACHFTKCIGGSFIPGLNRCVSGTEDTKDVYFEEMSFWEFIIKKIQSVVTLGLNVFFEKDYYECLKIQEDEGFDFFEYAIEEDVDLCSYYEWLMEEDYLEKRPRLIERFASTTTDNYDDLKYSIKKEVIDEIISAVEIANTSDPITIIEGSKQDLYTVSEEPLVTVSGGSGPSGVYPLDLYVQGVLSAEVGVLSSYRSADKESWAEVKEVYKAMAIAIRSYTFARTNGLTTSIVNSSQAQNMNDQVFLDETEARKTHNLIMRAAALETSGVVLMEDGKVFSAEYDSYYKGDDYYCDDEWCYSNYLIKGNDEKVYHWVKIPSSWEKRVYGGHGRGMSQLGAYYLGTKGWTYKQILHYFYGNQVSMYFYDYSENYNSDKGYYDIDYGNGSTYSDEAVLSCKYNIEMPLRITGLTNYDIYGFAGLECLNVGQRVRGRYCTTSDVADTITNSNKKVIEKALSYISNPSKTMLLANKVETAEDVKEQNTPDVLATPVNIFGPWDGQIVGNDVVDNARSLVGFKADELNYYFNTNDVAWSASFVSFIFKTLNLPNMAFRSNDVKSWIYYLQNTNQFYSSDYWSDSVNNPDNYQKFNNVNNAGGPKVGDIIFFFNDSCEYKGDGLNTDLNYMGCYKHMGIISNVEEDIITYVHGNTTACMKESGVCESTINLHDSYIVGYGKY